MFHLYKILSFAILSFAVIIVLLYAHSNFSITKSTKNDNLKSDVVIADVTSTTSSNSVINIKQGMQRINLTLNDKNRYFLVHRPKNVATKPAVLLVLHGGGGSAEDFAIRTESFINISETRGFLLVYPDGEKNWNDGRISTQGSQDDVIFLREVVKWLEKNANADRNRVFATGISNGGMMSHKLACDAPDLVAGIAPVAASMSEALFKSCRPVSATPVAMFSGTADRLNLYNGGSPRFSDGPDIIVSHEIIAAFWAQVANCDSSITEPLPNRYNDGTSVTVINYICPKEQVVLYRIEGGGHTWPGGQPATGPTARIIGLTTQEIDATDAITNFFANYGLW